MRPWRSRHSVATSCCRRRDHSRAYRPCRAADVPSNCLPRGRLGRGVSEVLPVGPCRTARSSGAADSKREVPGLAARRERGRRERLRLGQYRWHHISARGAAMPSARFDTCSSTLTARLRRFLTRLRRRPRCPVRRTCCGRLRAGHTCSGASAGSPADTVEALEKHLARKLGTDPAATACTQVTRLPGFVNHKRATPYRRKYRVSRHETACTSRRIFRSRRRGSCRHPHPWSSTASRNAVVRARQYVAAIPPAISGQHGDVHTFRVCCRVVRGFALADDEALDVLREWNSRCEPPWSDRELMDKLSRAHRYGREPIGCLLEERP